MALNRRDFITLASASAALGVTKVGIGSERQASNALETTDRDRYGGSKALHFEATGFFRLEKADR